jgi:glycosyltransferase involved in cell wall biosynthesis
VTTACAKKVLYIQYTDPAAYPPIEHSAHILAKRGWEVVVLGTKRFGDTGMTFSVRPQVRVKYLNWEARSMPLSFHYFFFLIWCLYWVMKWKPSWVYASDPLITPIAWLLQRLTRTSIVYHEHDAPQVAGALSFFQRIVRRYRKYLATSAQLCVVPQERRLAEFIQFTGRRAESLCVWNCPDLEEIERNVHRKREVSSEKEPLTLYYHGSINAERLPPHLIEAATRFKGEVRFRIGGYEAPGSTGHIARLLDVAQQNGCPDIIEFVGVVPTRPALLESASKADIGLSLISMLSSDPNLKFMVGASNKPFDYMLCGLPLLVSSDPHWISTFVAPGYARACDPSDIGSIIEALSWYRDHPDARRAMGDHCRTQIRTRWNYEAQFMSVVRVLEGDPALNLC